MRYRGQAFELTTPWPEATDVASVDAQSLDALIENFHRIHEQRFTFTAKEDPVEIVSVRARAIGTLNKPANDATVVSAEVSTKPAASAASSKTRKLQ